MASVLDDPVLAQEIDALIGRRVEAAIRMATPNEEIGIIQDLDPDLAAASVLLKGRLVPQIAIADRVPVEGDRVLIRTDQSTGLRYVAAIFGRPLDESGGVHVHDHGDLVGLGDHDHTQYLQTGGQIPFPGTANLSGDPNVLDDYEEGTWDPVFGFATPGNLSITYSDQAGRYLKIGAFVFYWFRITTSAFTHTTASGNALITGLPFSPGATNQPAGGTSVQGYTKANFTVVTGLVSTAPDAIRLNASGSGQTAANLTAADFPTGGTLVIRGSGFYFTNS